MFLCPVPPAYKVLASPRGFEPLLPPWRGDGTCLAPTHLSFLAVFVLRFLARLPLHIATMVTATRAKGHDVVYDVSGTPTLCFSRTWAWVLSNESRTLRGVALIFGEARERGYEGEQYKRLE